MMGIIENGGFENGYRPLSAPDGTKPHHTAYVYEVDRTGGQITKRYTVERGEIHNPVGWWAWYAHQRNDETPVPWDPANRIGWSEPEIRLTETVHQRHRSGATAAYLFTWRRIHEGGLLQQVSVTPGAHLRFTAYTHAWIGDDDHPPTWSLPGYDALAWPAGTPGLNDDQRSVTQSVGIDPTGGTDPYAPTVIWSDAWHIFNAYRAEPLEVEAVAAGDKVTVFLRSSTLWPVIHNDVAWDDAELIVVGEEETPPEPPATGAGPYIARGTKIGYHCIAPRSVPEHVMQLAQQGAPVPLVKFVDDWAGMDTVKAISPQTLIMARKTFGLDGELVGGLDNMTPAQIEAHALQLMALLRQKCLEETSRLPYIDYLETVVNEADPKSADGHGYRNLALLMLQMLDIAEKWDLPCKKLALFSLNCGTPEWVDYLAMVETGVFERMQAGGHVLSLHEGTLAVGGYSWEEAPIDLWWGPEHTIPGAPDVAGSGSLSFRYRYLLHLLRQRGVYVPVVISEFYAGGGYAGADPAAILARMRWYDELAAQDPELLAFTPYTFGGAGVGWDEQDYDFLLPALFDYTLAVKERVNAVPAVADPESPSLEHVVTVNLLPQDTTLAELQMVTAYLHPGRRSFVYSADDAAYLAAGGKPGSKVVVWEADRWSGDIEAYLRARGVLNVVRASFSDFEEAEPPAANLIAYSQNDPRWKELVYAGGATFGASGCLVTCIAMLAGVEPPETAARLRAAKAFNGAYLSNPQRIPEALPQLEYGGYRHWRESAADLNLLRQEIIAYGATICEVRWNPSAGGPVPGNQHFVVVESIAVDEATIIDPWDGERKSLRASRYCLAHETAAHALTGVRLVRRVEEVEPPTSPTVPLFGLHDESGENEETGARWLMARGLQGLIVRPVYLGTHPQMLDFSAEEAAGLRVIVNLRYSFARDNGGQGAFPLPGTPAWALFVEAAAQTLITSRGVWGWEIGNEMNNPREFPEAGPLTPEIVVQTYNAIRARVWQSIARPRMAPGALDPYNAQAGDPRQWLRAIWNGINGAEFTAAHGYVRGPDPKLINSAARFADHPLTWQYLNYPGCVTALLDALPAWVVLPIYITEFNHIWRDGGEGDWGWVSDARAAEIVRLARDAAAQCGFAGVALYRWAGDEWRIQGNAAVLNALEALLRE